MALVLSHVSTTDITSSTSSVNLSLPSDFSIFQLLGEDITGSGTLTFYLRVSTDGGSTFKSGSTDYNTAGRYRYVASNGSGSVNIGVIGGSNHIEILKNSGSVSDGFNFNYHLYGANNSALRFCMNGAYTAVDSVKLLDTSLSGSYDATTVVTDIQISMASGTIESGKIRLYGVA
jgi:hypothetical protein